jgi:transcriptional regulator with XRE-family HTH domain
MQDVDFSARLNRLFDVVRSPDGKPYSNEAVVSSIDEHGWDHVSTGYLSELRSGKKTNPSLRAILALSKFFDVDPAYFVSNADTADQMVDQKRMLQGLELAAVHRLALRAGELNSDERSIVEALIGTVLANHDARNSDPKS